MPTTTNGLILHIYLDTCTQFKVCTIIEYTLDCCVENMGVTKKETQISVKFIIFLHSFCVDKIEYKECGEISV